MFFSSNIMKKTVQELRKNQCLTAKELAQQLKLDTIEILKIDDLKLKDVPEPLKSKLIPILRGDYMDKIPWL
nr:transcriptional regulator [Desulfosporosinus sp. PR]